MEDKETIVAAAIIVIVYWWLSSKAEAAELTSKEEQVKKEETALPGKEAGLPGEGAIYMEDTSHIFIKYPGLSIFTPLKSKYGVSEAKTNIVGDSNLDVEQYLSSLRNIPQQSTYYPSDLNAQADIYIAAPILTVENTTQISTIGPVRILADQLFKNANIEIPRILSNKKYPVEMSSISRVVGKGGVGNNYYAVYKVSIKYPKTTPEIVYAVEQVLTNEYAYSYGTLKSIFGDI